MCDRLEVRKRNLQRTFCQRTLAVNLTSMQLRQLTVLVRVVKCSWIGGEEMCEQRINKVAFFN